MRTLTTAELLKYADLKMAVEAFLVELNGTLKNGMDLTEALKEGNLSPTAPPASAAPDSDAFKTIRPP